MKTCYSVLLSIGLLVSVAAFSQIPPQPNPPVSCNSNNCTPALSENCVGGSNVITSFTGNTLRSGTAAAANALYTFYNVANVAGTQINATVKIDGQLNCNMNGSNFSIDDDAAVDQANVSIASFFAPRITPSSSLNGSDLRGYVQFTISFFTENGTAGEQYPGDYTNIPPLGGLTGLNYIHYDIDGSTVGNGGWFRETGVIKDVTGSVINANAPTELVSYVYNDGANWKGFAGSVCERDGVSRCSQVAVAANYILPQTSITVRMGYDYNFTTANYGNAPTRQYGSRFGCFTFPQIINLPVRLLTFNCAYNNGHTMVNWTTDNEVAFDHFDVERSQNGMDYATIGSQPSKGGLGRSDYTYNDDLSAVNGNVFYYRLKMVDDNGQYKYSQVVLIRKDNKTIKGLSVQPNPVTNGIAMVKMTASAHGTAELRVIDLNGRVLVRQSQNVYEGQNSISVNVDRLQPGIYSMQMMVAGDMITTKFSIGR
ncbi:MAG TPA: T9SS type A sorting domain-containing protein [Chitinophagaceae bacterium]|nr:T9SS type A sorting domain-containing protein [Chitinophagaceae bacterium]